MGRKVNPIGFRLGIVTDWESKWYAERNYTEQLHEDLRIRRLILNELTRAGISRIELERSANKVDVTLHTRNPESSSESRAPMWSACARCWSKRSTRRCICGSKRSR